MVDRIDPERLYTLKELEAQGFHPKAVQRLVKAGRIESPARGIYISAEHEPHILDDEAVLAKKCPEAVLNLYTAARIHGITQVVPAAIWIGLPPSHPNAPSIGGGLARNLAVLRWKREADAEAGVETMELRGATLRFTGLERTVVDMWRYSSHNPSLRAHPPRIDDENLLHCMGAYLEKSGGSTRKLAEMARRVGLGRTAAEEFFAFCKHVAGGYAFGRA